jgi:hypothetical protein
MPNWCNNEVSISGSAVELSKLMALIKDNSFFQNVLPMPEELNGFSSPVHILSQEEFEEQEKRFEEWKAMSEEEKREKNKTWFSRGMTEEMSTERKALFGVDNWYDWCVRNWGTKWDVRKEDIEMQYEHGDTFAELAFMTAWSPPEGIKMKLDEMFPDLDISWFYREDGCQIAGWL